MAENKILTIAEGIISQRDGYCGGEPHITGKRIKVRHILEWHEEGVTEHEMIREYHLTPLEIHAALAYAYEHIGKLRTAITTANEFAEQFRQQHPPILSQASIDAIKPDDLEDDR